MFCWRQYITVARTVCSSVSHRAIREAISIDSSSLERCSDNGGMHLVMAEVSKE